MLYILEESVPIWGLVYFLPSYTGSVHALMMCDYFIAALPLSVAPSGWIAWGKPIHNADLVMVRMYAR